jgi:hypothetical protein
MNKDAILLGLDTKYRRLRLEFHRSLAAGLIGLLLSMPATAGLIVSGVVDGDITGGLPKAIELYATSDIADLSIYGVGSANNGGGTDGVELTLSGSASKGDYIYVATESTEFQNFFGFAPTFTSSAASINGDDAIEVFQSGTVIDTFGDINAAGLSQPWSYGDGWAYRESGTGPDGSAFDIANWAFSGNNALDGETSNATATNPVPFGTYELDPAELIITGVIDGPITGGLPKAIELFATGNIPDLSAYGVGSANNGGGSDGEELTLTGQAKAGDFIYIATDATEFANFFGFAPDFISSAASINGNDAIELFHDGLVADVFGDINVDGSGEPWEYMDGWAYRVSGTGPDGNVFVLPNWYFSGPNALDGESMNATANTPFPIGTFAVPEPWTLALLALGLAGMGYQRRSQIKAA